MRPVHGRRLGQGHRGVDRDRVARGAGRGADRERRAAGRDLRPAVPPSLQAHAAGEVRHRLLRRARARDRPPHLHQRRPQHRAAGARRRHHRGPHHLRPADRAAARGDLRAPRGAARAGRRPADLHRRHHRGREQGRRRVRPRSACATATRKNFRLPIADLAEAIQNEVGEFVGEVPFADDRTMLLLQRVADPPAPPRDRGSRSGRARGRARRSLLRAPRRVHRAARRAGQAAARVRRRRRVAPRQGAAQAHRGGLGDQPAASREQRSRRDRRGERRVAGRARATRDRPRTAASRSSRGAERSSERPRPWSSCSKAAGSSVSPALLRRIERTLLALATGASAGAETRPFPDGSIRSSSRPGSKRSSTRRRPRLRPLDPYPRPSRPPLRRRQRSARHRLGRRRTPQRPPARRPSLHRRQPRPPPWFARSPATRRRSEPRRRRSTAPRATSSERPTGWTRRE